MTKHVLQPLALTLGCALLLASCIADDSDGDNSGCGTTGQGARGLYVVNQGNTGYSILGTLDWIDTEADTLASDIFSRANGQALGESPQNAVISGSKMYISEFTSNRIWVVSAATSALFDRIADPKLTVRRLTLTANRVVKDPGIFQTDFFTDAASLEKEKSLQEAMLELKKRFGKNAVLKGSNYLEGATMRDRNGRIGGHKAE